MTGCGVVVAVAVALAAVAARHAEHPESSPVSPSGHWSATWTVAVVVALVAYGAALVVGRGGRAPLRSVLAVTVVIQALPLVSPLLLSKDVYAYWNHARIVTVHHGNPYADAPDRFPEDASFPYVSESWRASTTAYQPLWELASVAPATAAGASAHRAELAYRLFALLGILTAVGLVAQRTRNPAAAAFVGWSPLVALHVAGGGHNDAWVTAFLVLAVLGVSDGARGGAWAGATFVKGFPALLLPLELARLRLRASRSFWIGLIGGALALAAAAFAAFGTAWLTTALQGAHTNSGMGGVHWLQQLGLRHRDAVALAGLVFAGVYALLLVLSWRNGRRCLALAACVLCVTTSGLRPWYALWPVALAAAEEDVLAAVVAFGLTTYLLLGDAISL